MQNKIICADCLDIIPGIEDKSIDILITDPPYKISTHGNGLAKDRKGWVNDIRKDGIDVFDPIPFLEAIKPKLKLFHAYIFTSKSLLSTYINWIEEQGYGWDMIIMAKSNPIPAKSNKYLNDKEYCLFIREPGGCYFNNKADYSLYYTVKQTISKKPEYGHPTEKPLHIIADFIKLSSRPGDLVFDPYLGSGTTAVASLLLQRNFLGIENKSKYVKIAKKRIDAHINDMFI